MHDFAGMVTPHLGNKNSADMYSFKVKQVDHVNSIPFKLMLYIFIQKEWVLRELVYLLHISFQSWGAPFCPDEDLLLFCHAHVLPASH